MLRFKNKVKSIAANHKLDAYSFAVCAADHFRRADQLLDTVTDQEAWDQWIKDFARRNSPEIRGVKNYDDEGIGTPRGDSKWAMEASDDQQDEERDLGLFTPTPRFASLPMQSMPVLWLSLSTSWPVLLKNFLEMIWCSPLSEDDGTGQLITKQRLQPVPDIVCWSKDHSVLYAFALSGLLVWCVGGPVVLYLRILHLGEERQSANNLRTFGYFIQGYEYNYWWWDLVTKRFDIGVMMIITYTSIAPDDKAKLMLLPFVSGVMLALNAWNKPLINVQAEILDVVESSLLGFRFLMFSMIAAMLIFNPSAEVNWVGAVFLALSAFFVFFIFAIHTVAQIARQNAASNDATLHALQQLASENHGLKTPPKKGGFRVIARMIKQFAKQALLSVLLPGEHEKMKLRWSAKTHEIHVVHTFDDSQTMKGGRKSLCEKIRLKLWSWRSTIMRFDQETQRQAVSMAVGEFAALWVGHLRMTSVTKETVGVAFALAACCSVVTTPTSSKDYLPSLRRTLQQILVDANEHEKKDFFFDPDDICNVCTLLQNLHSSDAEGLVRDAEAMLRGEVASERNIDDDQSFCLSFVDQLRLGLSLNWSPNNDRSLEEPELLTVISADPGMPRWTSSTPKEADGKLRTGEGDMMEESGQAQQREDSSAEVGQLECQTDLPAPLEQTEKQEETQAASEVEELQPESPVPLENATPEGEQPSSNIADHLAELPVPSAGRETMNNAPERARGDMLGDVEDFVDADVNLFVMELREENERASRETSSHGFISRV